MLFRPYSTYRFLFEESSAEYYRSFVMYLSWTVLAALITWFLVKQVLNSITIITFILAVLIVAVVPNIIFLLLSYRSAEFADWRKRIGSILRKYRKK